MGHPWQFAAGAGFSRAKRVASVALRIVGAIVALLAIVVGGSLVVVKTEWGGERLRRQVVSRVNQQIQGNLAIERLAFGGNKIAVWGVTLRDPEGGIVAGVARAEVDFAVLRLLRKELRVTAVAIETPVVNLVSDEDGSNLSRATAARHKPAKAAEPKKKMADPNAPEGWVVRLDRLDLTNGDIRTATVTAGDNNNSANATVTTTPKVHVANVRVFANARVATGNGATDVTVRVSGDSERAPVGPLRLAAHVATHGGVYRFDADGDLLSGTLKARGNIDTRHLETADALLALDIPRQEIASYGWGPFRVDGRAEPGKAPKLDATLKVPGVELVAKDGGVTGGRAEPALEGRLTVADLSVTGKAVAALTGTPVPPLGGRGEVTFAVDVAKGKGAAARTNGAFETLRFGETLISRLTLDGEVARLSRQPESASLDLGIASVRSGATDIKGIALSAKVRAQEVAATFEVASPARIDLDLKGRLSSDPQNDRQLFDLNHLAVAFPGGRWVSEGVARLRSDPNELSLSSFRLTSEGQALAIDGGRRGENFSAHVALTDLRLGKLPTALIDPKLRLDGLLNVDVKATGQADAPKVVARVDLKRAAYQGFSKIDAKVDAKLENDQVDATMDVDAPFMALNGALKLPTDLGPGEPIDVKVDVKHVDVGLLMRAAERPALADGRLNLKLLADGSADAPKVVLTMEAFDLEVKRPADKARGQMAQSADLGKARVRVTYADRAARAEVDFTSAHGGTLRVDAGTRVNLSYPHIKRRPIVAAKLPIQGKVTARDLDVAWVAQVNPRLESMAGQVTADVRLKGTVGDPEVIGDVRWKNGKVVATAHPPGANSAPQPRSSPAGKRPPPGAPQARRPSSVR